jgi:hypothetical protein
VYTLAVEISNPAAKNFDAQLPWLIWAAALPNEFRDQIVHLPLK